LREQQRDVSTYLRSQDWLGGNKSKIRKTVSVSC
jgi:hypothetical protein